MRTRARGFGTKFRYQEGPQTPELSGRRAVFQPENRHGLWLVADDGDTVLLYYGGAADTSVCVATESLSALLTWLERHAS